MAKVPKEEVQIKKKGRGRPSRKIDKSSVSSPILNSVKSVFPTPTVKSTSSPASSSPVLAGNLKKAKRKSTSPKKRPSSAAAKSPKKPTKSKKDKIEKKSVETKKRQKVVKKVEELRRSRRSSARTKPSGGVPVVTISDYDTPDSNGDSNENNNEVPAASWFRSCSIV